MYLGTKIRDIATKCPDDSHRVRELESRIAEAGTFVSLWPKLQAKLNSLRIELIATHCELSDSRQLTHLTETRIVDA